MGGGGVFTAVFNSTWCVFPPPGGSGTLGLQFAKTYPQMSVTVMDLEHVTNVAQHFMPSPRPENLSFEPG